MSDLTLTVNGAQYGGWKRISVRRSIETISGSFNLGVSDKWAEQASAWPIKPGDECKVALQGTTIITGYVDSRNISYSDNSHDFSVDGRDRTADLVDS